MSDQLLTNWYTGDTIAFFCEDKLYFGKTTFIFLYQWDKNVY